MRPHLAAAGLLLGLLPWAAKAVTLDGPQTEAPKEKQAPLPKPGEIPALIAARGAADWQVREQAMRDLVALGEGARPSLRLATRSTDAEVRWRATHALSLMETRLEPTEPDAARTLYASAARAAAQKDGADAARELYAEVAKRCPASRWAAAARERLAALRAGPKPPAPKPASQEALAQLVAKLALPSWTERQDASRRLADLGEAARPALEAAAAGPDPEAAWRARSLLQRLEAARPSEAARPAAPNVRLFIEPGERDPRPKSRKPETNDLDALVNNLGAEDASEVAHAREVLLSVGRDALPALLRALDDCEEVLAVEIMDLLREITRQKLGFDRERWRAWGRTRQGGEKDGHE